jgi:signal transduction histidine kinase
VDETDRSLPDSLNDVVQKLVAEKNLLISERKKSIRISVVSEERLDEVQIPDLIQLERIISNIIDNSIDSIADIGTVEIRLNKSGEELQISICDTGHGIKPEILPSLFQKGFSSGKIAGTGLGLYSAKKILESWGWTINISSKLGHGTQVRISG